MITFLRNLIVRDFWLKLLSFVLAVLIWITVTYAANGGKTLLFNRNVDELSYYNVPVQILVSAAEVRSFKVNPSEVEVRVRGEPGKLRELHAEEIHAILDLTDIQSARGLQKRIKVNITSPDITVVRVEPAEVEVIVPPLK
jgi:YbbR domain-containing protein